MLQMQRFRFVLFANFPVEVLVLLGRVFFFHLKHKIFVDIFK